MLRELPLREQIGFARTFGVITVVWTLGDVVRKLRDDKGWTQAELGRRADGLDKSAVVRLERESNKSERTTIRRVARALGVSVADLHAYEEEAIESAKLTETERQAVSLFRLRLIEKRQRAVSNARDSSPPRDLPATTHESHGPVQKRRR